MNNQNKIICDCFKCEYFYITWDKYFPKGCKLFGFKSANVPSHTVHEATGSQCQNFKKKKSK